MAEEPSTVNQNLPGCTIHTTACDSDYISMSSQNDDSSKSTSENSSPIFRCENVPQTLHAAANVVMIMNDKQPIAEVMEESANQGVLKSGKKMIMSVLCDGPVPTASGSVYTVSTGTAYTPGSTGSVKIPPQVPKRVCTKSILDSTPSVGVLSPVVRSDSRIYANYQELIKCANKGSPNSCQLLEGNDRHDPTLSPQNVSATRGIGDRLTSRTPSSPPDGRTTVAQQAPLCSTSCAVDTQPTVEQQTSCKNDEQSTCNLSSAASFAENCIAVNMPSVVDLRLDGMDGSEKKSQDSVDYLTLLRSRSRERLLEDAGMCAENVKEPKPSGSEPRRSPSSIGSFTTEDMDMFPRATAMADTSPPVRIVVATSETPTGVVTRAKRQDSSTTAVQRKSRRRSKSVGAPGFRSKFNLFNEKPKVPIKPKFTEKLITGLGLPQLTPIVDKSPSPAPNISHTTNLDENQKSHGINEHNLDNSNRSLFDNNPCIFDINSMLINNEICRSENSSATSNNTRSTIMPPAHVVIADANLHTHSSGETKRYTGIACPMLIHVDHSKINSLNTTFTEESKTTADSLTSIKGQPSEKERSRQTSARKVSRKESRKTLRKASKREQRMQRLFSKEFDDDWMGNDEEEEEFMISGSDTDGEENGRGSLSDTSDTEFDESLMSALQRERSFQEEDDAGSKALRTATELLLTERNYVKKLHLVDQVFHFTIVVKNRELHMFPNEVIPQMFSNIKSIYQFHHDFLLPQLEKRMDEWIMVPKIADVVKKFAPFLKLYTEYVRNFDNAMNTINWWMDKSPRFLKIIEELQNKPECGQLTLQHHMLEPIQRVPRYELLLKDYLKHLPADSPDKEDTLKALELVTTAASHSNEAMRKIEQFRKLLDINEGLGGAIDLVSPTREFIKEGKIIRISARDKSHMERILFLFTDMLLVCSSLPLKIGHRQQYRVKAKLDIDGMAVKESHNLDTPNTFYVKGKQKSIEFHASSHQEMLEWMMTLWSVIADYGRRQRSRQNHNGFVDALQDDELGKRAPTWVRDQETSMCMRCCIGFTPIRRRHHCRACGIVVCGKCSSKKSRLAYADNHKERVCDVCFDKLAHMPKNDANVVNKAESSNRATICTRIPMIDTHCHRGPAILNVKASEPCIIAGYLNFSSNGRNWTKRWFSVHDNFVLYSFKANMDIVALTSLPLPGYKVSVIEDPENPDKDRLFQLSQIKVYGQGYSGENKMYIFLADNPTSRNRWVEVLEKVVVAELPSEIYKASC